MTKRISKKVVVGINMIQLEGYATAYDRYKGTMALLQITMMQAGEDEIFYVELKPLILKNK